MGYIDLLKNIDKKHIDNLSNKNTKDTVLMIDGTNTFIRSWSMSSISNDNGEPIGGYGGFMLSMGYAIKRFLPNKVVIVFDGKDGSNYRKQLLPEYKANRQKNKKVIHKHLYNSLEEEQENKELQLKRLIDYLLVFPVQILIADYIEADDIISYLATEYFTDYNKVIMSTDKDFYQLINDNTKIYEPTNKMMYDSDTMVNEYNFNINNLLLIKCITGDGSDNIPGIKGSGNFSLKPDALKTLRKNLPILFDLDTNVTMDDLYEYISTAPKSKFIQNLMEGKEQLELNYKLSQLSETILNDNQKIIVNNQLNKPVNKLNKTLFLAMLIQDQMNNYFKNPMKWLDDCFKKLNFSNL